MVLKPKIEAAVKAVEELLDVEFKNKLLLVQALTHRSYLNENESHPTGHYERLEFMGDAVLEIIVTEHIYQKDEDATEGELTHQRAVLVNSEALGQVAVSLNITDHMFMSKGERNGFTRSLEGKKAQMYICACFFEALLGALYLDQGIGACRMIVDHYLLKGMSKKVESQRDTKGDFQELSQERFGITPHYEVVERTGSDHSAHFRIACCLGGSKVAEGEGTSKKEAQKAAAKRALETVSEWEGRFAQPITVGSVKRHSSNSVYGGKR